MHFSTVFFSKNCFVFFLLCYHVDLCFTPKKQEKHTVN